MQVNRSKAAAPRRVIVFDLDDTLYLECSFADSGFRAADNWLEKETGVSGLHAQCAALFSSGQRTEVFNHALRSLGVGNEDDLVKQLVDVYRTHEPDIALASDAARYLRDRSTEVAYALITDGHLTTQMAKVRALELDRMLGRTICTGTWGRDFWKPHPKAFQAVEAWSGSSASDLVYVADNPLKDFVTPRARGWWTVQITRPERVHHTTAPDPEHEAHETIPSLDVLNDCLIGLDEGWSIVKTA